MTRAAPNMRRLNDSQVSPALAAPLAKIDITVHLDLLPKANFFSYIRLPADKSGIAINGRDVPSGDAGKAPRSDQGGSRAAAPHP